MKRFISVSLLCSFLLLQICTFSSCNSFVGGKEGFFTTGDFYNNVGNTFFSVFAGDTSFIPLANDKSLLLDAGISLTDYKVNGFTVEDGKANIDVRLLSNNNFDYDYSLDISAFGMDFNKHLAQKNNEMLIEYTDIISKPLYYCGNDLNALKYAYDGLVALIEDANYIDGEETYKFNDINFDTKTVSFTLNTDVLNAWAVDLSNRLYFSDNLVFLEWYYTFNEVMYFIDNEKIHLTWKRYFDGNDLCREVIKLHDNNNHNITADLIFASDDGIDYAELCVTGYDGTTNFDILVISANKIINGNKFETNGKIMLGDEVLITAKNKGDSLNASGSAAINYVSGIGEMTIPVSYDYVGSSEGDKHNDGIGLTQKINISVNGLNLSFSAAINIFADYNDEAPNITKPADYYNIGSTTDIYYYNTIGRPENSNIIDAITDGLEGKNIYYEQISDTEGESNGYNLDIRYDDGNNYETDGAYGKEFVSRLMSDKYAYRYSYYINEKDESPTEVSIYKDGDQKMYNYRYSDGVVYDEYFEGTVRNEIRHDIATIIYTEYTEEEFSNYYADVIYIYYESGYCEYNNRKLVYERYYDYANNKYTFIFDENSNVEIIVINSSNDGSLLYTFVAEISDEVPDDAFDLPDYDRFSVLDFFGE